MARTFRNIGTTEIRIDCQLVVPAGHTSLPIELGGLVVTDKGELQIRREQELIHLTVQEIGEMTDLAPPPAAPSGSRDAFPCGTVDGQVLADDVLTVSAAPTEVTVGGHRALQYPVSNARSGAAINILTMAQLGVNSRWRAASVGGQTASIAGTTYRMVMLAAA